MNKFTIECTENGFIETLEHNGETIVKKYNRDKWGYEGENQSWEYEDLPSELIGALEDRDMLSIMDALKDED